MWFDPIWRSIFFPFNPQLLTGSFLRAFQRFSHYFRNLTWSDVKEKEVQKIKLLLDSLYLLHSCMVLRKGWVSLCFVLNWQVNVFSRMRLNINHSKVQGSCSIYKML